MQGNIMTEATYVLELALYLRGLKSKKALLGTDELTQDDLVCVFRSDLGVSQNRGCSRTPI